MDVGEQTAVGRGGGEAFAEGEVAAEFAVVVGILVGIEMREQDEDSDETHGERDGEDEKCGAEFHRSESGSTATEAVTSSGILVAAMVFATASTSAVMCALRITTW